MKKIFGLIALSCSLAVSLFAKPVALECEHLENPLGLDVAKPRFSWRMDDTRNGALQTAYRIMVDTDADALQNGRANVWDSGKVMSDAMLVVFNGKDLESFTKYFWKVIIWDETGTETAASASFETAMMSQKEWQGKWISDSHDFEYRPAPYLRKEFLTMKNIKSARAYVAAAGLFELSVNGKKVGDHLMDPMYTRFDKRTLYVTFDITDLVKEGDNAVGLTLGNGWYNHQSVAVWDFHKAHWRNRPRALANIRVVYDNGSVETISTDETWKTADSPIVFNSIYTAEHYDARKEFPGWDKPKFDDSKWENATVVAKPSQNLVAQKLVPIRVTEELTAVKVDKKSDTRYVFTFPKTIAGITRLTVNGPEGAEIRVKHAEMIDDKGEIEMWNVERHYSADAERKKTDPFATDVVILNGKGELTFSPKFGYKGFRYAEVTTSVPMNLTKDNLVALEMHSDVPVAGSIKTSNPLMDKIWAATNSSYLANLFSYPTDCPQREKNGWTGDAHIAIETGLYSFDAITVYEKWLADHQDEQRADGNLPPIIPTHGWGWSWDIGPDWTSSVAIIPWEIYKFYGDSRLLEIMYENIKRYVDYMESRSPNGLTDMGLGDWVPVSTKPPRELTSSIYVYIDTDILAKTAKLFGKTEDAKKYAALAEKIKEAVNDKYLNKETGVYGTGMQTEQAMPLFWGIVPEDVKAKVAENLYKKVKESNFHLDVGLLGSKALLGALSQNGYADAAYKIASQKTYPSWGWWIVNGATTLYESWRTDDKYEASLNHIMFGQVGAYMYQDIGGIFPDEKAPGFKHIILKPNFVSGLDSFEAKHLSPYGEIVSKWNITDGSIRYSATIPPNSTATIYLPKSSLSDPQATKAGAARFFPTREEGGYIVIELPSGTHSGMDRLKQ